MKCIDPQYGHFADRQFETHQQGTGLADFSLNVFSAEKLLTHSLVVVTVPSATKSAIETQGRVPLLQYSVSFRGGVFPIE